MPPRAKKDTAPGPVKTAPIPALVETPAPAHEPELHPLRQREKNLVEKMERLNKMDKSEHRRSGVDLNQVIRKTNAQLEELRKEIKKAGINE